MRSTVAGIKLDFEGQGHSDNEMRGILDKAERLSDYELAQIVHLTNYKNSNLLSEACGFSYSKNFVERLIKAGSDIDNLRDFLEITPLSIAISQGNAELTETLIDAGANLEGKPKGEQYNYKNYLDKMTQQYTKELIKNADKDAPRYPSPLKKFGTSVGDNNFNTKCNTIAVLKVLLSKGITFDQLGINWYTFEFITSFQLAGLLYFGFNPDSIQKADQTIKMAFTSKDGLLHCRKNIWDEAIHILNYITEKREWENNCIRIITSIYHPNKDYNLWFENKEFLILNHPTTQEIRDMRLAISRDHDNKLSWESKENVRNGVNILTATLSGKVVSEKPRIKYSCDFDYGYADL